MPQMRYAAFKHVYLVVHGVSSPTAEEWPTYMADHQAACARGVTKVLVWTAGGALSAPQRSEASDMFKKYKTKNAVCTESTLAAGVITALGWLGVDIRRFRVSEPEEALKWLNLANDEVQPVLNKLSELRRELSC